MKEAMRHVILITLLVFVAQSHAEDKFIDLPAFAAQAHAEEVVADDVNDSQNSNAHGEEVAADDMNVSQNSEDELIETVANELLARLETETSVDANADLDAATLGKPGNLLSETTPQPTWPGSSYLAPFFPDQQRLTSEEELEREEGEEEEIEEGEEEEVEEARLRQVLGLRGGAKKLKKLDDRVIETMLDDGLDTAMHGKPKFPVQNDSGSQTVAAKDKFGLVNDAAASRILQAKDKKSAMKAKTAMKAMKAKTAMKAMKAMQVMKSMKAMKAMKAMQKNKRVSKIAKGKMAKYIVFRGGKEKTVGGLAKSDLIKNKRGKIVSKKQSAVGKKAFDNIKGWVDAVVKARKALGVKGFVPIKKGTPLYTKSKQLYKPPTSPSKKKKKKL